MQSLPINLDPCGSLIEKEALLRILDGAFHFKMKHASNSGILGSRRFIDVSHFHDRKMTYEQLEAVLRMVDGKDFVMYPSTESMGLRVAFNVARVMDPIYGDGLRAQAEPVLMFSEEQLPRGASYSLLEKTFKGEANVKGLKRCSMDMPKRRRDYDFQRRDTLN
jgi:hypothetical protein